jgi:nitrous oxide reductase accessory protein NosL
MRRALVAVVLAVAFAGCSSSSSSSDPVALCKQAFTNYCNRAFACYPTEAAQMWTNAQGCVTATVGQACPTSATTACTAPKTFNSTNANQCVADFANQSCTDVGNGVTPTSCDNVCT